jgi:hypothetical protein
MKSIHPVARPGLVEWRCDSPPLGCPEMSAEDAARLRCFCDHEAFRLNKGHGVYGACMPAR